MEIPSRTPWKKIITYLIRIVGGLLIVGIIAGSLFIYKVTYGFPFYEHRPISIEETLREHAVLVYSKTNGFNHASAIKAANELFLEFGKEEGWSVTFTKSAGVFNDDQLALFDLVIWNNVTGRTLTDIQRIAFKKYIDTGGAYMGLHGSGDFSHHWDWYEQELIGAPFSHHTMNPQIQQATLLRSCDISFEYCSDHPDNFELEDEWYVFYENPAARDHDVLYTVKQGSIDSNGNLPLLVSDKDWGMYPEHPIIWKKCIDPGRSFYSAIGHSKRAFTDPNYKKILRMGIKWALGYYGACAITENN